MRATSSAPWACGSQCRSMPDGLGLLAREEARYIEAPAVHHAQREIDDPHLHAAIVQIARDRQESERIHLEHGGGGDHVAHRTIQDGPLAEVVDARRMQQQQIRLVARSDKRVTSEKMPGLPLAGL